MVERRWAVDPEIGRASSALLEVDYNAAGNSVLGMADDGRLILWRLRDRWAQAPRTLSGATSGTGISPSGDLLLLVRGEGAALQNTESGAVICSLSRAWSRMPVPSLRLLPAIRLAYTMPKPASRFTVGVETGTMCASWLCTRW